MKHLIQLLLIFISVHANAQFTSLNSFYDDSLLLAQAKKSGVRCVTEHYSRGASPYYNGHFCFDRKGRRIEVCTPAGRGIRRVKTEYNEQNLVSKQINFTEDDTSKIASWSTYTYDGEGSIIKETSGSYQDGKLTESIIRETKILSQQKFVTRKVTYNYYDHWNEPVHSLDSISGIYTFNIRYEYKIDDIDVKGRKNGQKEMLRTYTKNNCTYEDKIDYKVYGRIETVKELKTYYHQRDSKGRLIEFGIVNYDNAYMLFIQQHPEEYNYHSMSPKFIKALLTDKVKGEKEPAISIVYDANGRLEEKTHYGSHCTFKYNEKNQVIEQSYDGNNNSIDELYYNNKGMVSKVISRARNANGDGTSKLSQEITYTYTYY